MPDLNIDRETLKVLSSDVRSNILKSLQERRKTVTELAQEFNLSKSTLHEHLAKLTEANLIARNETYTDKFIYYDLTSKAKQILGSKENKLFDTRIVLLIAVTFVGLLVFFNLFFINPTQSLTADSFQDSLAQKTLTESETSNKALNSTQFPVTEERANIQSGVSDFNSDLDINQP
ncbi:MAG: winged helix-turn-helix domain-containing protein [Candidatus Diapherotrites archaeon]|nr:winged helix-turn-helix domain-containing protein [Candidatus Diapherotrites archaeon]